MNTFLIVLITLMVYWTIGTIVMLITKENETFAALYTMGLVYVLAYIIIRPIVILVRKIKKQ